MAALSDGTGTLKIVHTCGVCLHSAESNSDVYDPNWQRRQVNDFVDFPVLAEELGCEFGDTKLTSTG